MAVGFFIIWYVIGKEQSTVLFGSIVGVITEFIGATFLFVYRSTVEQAVNYTRTLERINSVGMAMKILDTISDDSRELRDQTKAEIVKLLLMVPTKMDAVKPGTE